MQAGLVPEKDAKTLRNGRSIFKLSEDIGKNWFMN